MEKPDINSLIVRAKASVNQNTIQKVVPVKEKSTEVQFSFYIEKELLKKLKLKALENDCSNKQIIIDLLTDYLNQN